MGQWSFAENVCTASYSLVWHSWQQWEEFLDWAALWGINLLPALTGQEEVQYKVFRALGLSDLEARGWFNGPALLTWSRGQNGKPTTHYISKWRNIWIRDVFCCQHLNSRCWWSQPKHVSDPG